MPLLSNNSGPDPLQGTRAGGQSRVCQVEWRPSRAECCRACDAASKTQSDSHTMVITIAPPPSPCSHVPYPRAILPCSHEPEVNLPSAHLLPCMPGAVWLRPTVAASILPEHPSPLASPRKPLNRRSNCGTHLFPLPGHRAMISSRPRARLFPVAIGYSSYLAVRHALTSLESLRFLRRVAASQNNP